MKRIHKSILLAVLISAIFGIHCGDKNPVMPDPLRLTQRKVDVGGYKLNIGYSGEGSTTVVMDAGLGEDMMTWSEVWPEVAKFTRVCVYDRAGRGKSDPGPDPRTSQQMVAELHTLLANAGITGPYVFVGHSFGGLNVRIYADQHRDQVVGMVLVDVSHEDQLKLFQARLSPADWAAVQSLLAQNPEKVDFEESLAQVGATGSLGNMPLVVLTAGKPDSHPAISAEGVAIIHQTWLELQAKLATLSSNSTQIIAKESGHYIHEQQPDLVINAIRQVVEAASKSQ